MMEVVAEKNRLRDGVQSVFGVGSKCPCSLDRDRGVSSPSSGHNRDGIGCRVAKLCRNSEK